MFVKYAKGPWVLSLVLYTKKATNPPELNLATEILWLLILDHFQSLNRFHPKHNILRAYLVQTFLESPPSTLKIASSEEAAWHFVSLLLKFLEIVCPQGSPEPQTRLAIIFIAGMKD